MANEDGWRRNGADGETAMRGQTNAKCAKTDISAAAKNWKRLKFFVDNKLSHWLHYTCREALGDELNIDVSSLFCMTRCL
jgi:hypothetical protein